MSPEVPFAADPDLRGSVVSLADHLGARHDRILEAWVAAVSADPNLASSDELSRGEFRDHIPQVLTEFGGTLLAEPRTGAAQAAGPRAGFSAGDGPHRWQYGYALGEVILEWDHLHHCVLDELAAARIALPALGPDVFVCAHHALASLIHVAMADSIEQCARLQQKEAIGERNEMERTIARFLENGRRRAALWRESAHNLRGQLTVITSAAALMEVADLEESLRVAAFGMLHSGAGALKKVLTDALESVARETDGEDCQWAAFDAGALIGGICAAAQPLARERGLSLRSHGPQPLAVEGDRGKVRRIAQNLLLDALAHTSRGGVTVSWQMDDADCWSLEVRDTGPGMPSGDSAPQARGTAPPRDEDFGLPIIQRLRKLLGARLHMESAPDTGTVSTVVFPRRYAA